MKDQSPDEAQDEFQIAFHNITSTYEKGGIEGGEKEGMEGWEAGGERGNGEEGMEKDRKEEKEGKEIGQGECKAEM